MAAGNPLFDCDAQENCGPATLFAQSDVIAGASSPAEVIPVLAFDSTTEEYADYKVRLPENYSGGGLTLRIEWAGGANSGAVVWSVAFRRIPDDAEDLDTTAFTYDYNNASAGTAPSAIGETSVESLAFTDGADMDSWAAGESAIMRVRRVPSDGGDTMAADARLLSVSVRETP